MEDSVEYEVDDVAVYKENMRGTIIYKQLRKGPQNSGKKTICINLCCFSLLRIVFIALFVTCICFDFIIFKECTTLDDTLSSVLEGFFIAQGVIAFISLLASVVHDCACAGAKCYPCFMIIIQSLECVCFIANAVILYFFTLAFNKRGCHQLITDFQENIVVLQTLFVFALAVVYLLITILVICNFCVQSTLNKKYRDFNKADAKAKEKGLPPPKRLNEGPAN